MEECLEYILIGGIAERHLPQVVVVHKLIEEISTQHYSLRDIHLGIRKLVKLLMALYNIVEKSESPALSAQGAVTDACEV